MTARLTALFALAVLATACGGSDNNTALEDESILTATIPGTANGKTSTESGKVTRLYDVTGDWVAVSIAIAELARSEGWTIQAINCVGSGNDVIAYKRVDDGWRLLESGAGTQGAGLIVSAASTQKPPGALQVSGNCPAALRAATGR